MKILAATGVATLVLVGVSACGRSPSNHSETAAVGIDSSGSSGSVDSGTSNNSNDSGDASEGTTAATAPAPTPIPSPTPTPAPTPGAGTGSTSAPRYVTGVTGGGATPSAASALRLTGAAGDCSSDDTAAIQAALDEAASQGRALLIPAPTKECYRISGMLHPAGSVIGDGSHPKIQVTPGLADGDGTHSIFYVGGYHGSGMVISGLTLDGGFSSATRCGDWAGCSGTAAVSGGSNNLRWSAAGGEYDQCLEFYDSDNLTFRDNFCQYTVGDGLQVGSMGDRAGYGCRNIIVDNNTFTMNYRNGVYVDGVDAPDSTAQGMVITNNVFDDTFGYANNINFELSAGTVRTYNVEIAYNAFNEYPTPEAGYTISRFMDDGASGYGGHLYVHHNSKRGTYGYGTVFMRDAGGTWDDTFVVCENGSGLGLDRTSCP